jgi:hypothetical protein
VDPTVISDQINRILRSQSFATKNQLRKLLEVLFRDFDSQTTLNADQVIKELWPGEIRTKRPADVATEINRLRNALESYYSAEGKTDPVTISLPKRSVPGSYGTQEKRWIEAKPRIGIEDEDRAPVPSASSRRGLKIIAAIAAIGIAIVTYISVRMLTVDDRPRSGRLDDTTLTIMNTEGKDLWRKSFPDGFWRDYYDEALAKRIWFGDLDGEGHTSVLLLYHPAISPRSHSTTLICYSDRGKEKWRWTPGRELPELEGSPATFRTSGLKVLNATDKKHSRILVSSWHDPFYPHQIAILDSNGKTLSEYWHSGHLDYLTLADLDGDGRQEILAAGISNGYHQATLVVLDPDRVFGASTEAARPEIQIHGMGVAQERFRLLFPRSDLNKTLSVYNEGQDTTVENGRIRFSVKECDRPGCLVWYEFDRNFDLLSALADDYFRGAYREFYLGGQVAHPLTAEEEAGFQKVRCLVGCKTEFVPDNVH